MGSASEMSGECCRSRNYLIQFFTLNEREIKYLSVYVSAEKLKIKHVDQVHNCQQSPEKKIKHQMLANIIDEIVQQPTH